MTLANQTALRSYQDIRVNHTSGVGKFLLGLKCILHRKMPYMPHTVLHGGLGGELMGGCLWDQDLLLLGPGLHAYQDLG